MRKKILLPILAVLFGVLGFLLRQLQLRTAFDAAGLPIPGSAATSALLGCTAAFLVCTGLLLLSLRGKTPSLTFDEAFRCEHSGYMTVVVFCAAILICGGLYGIYGYVTHALPNLFHGILGLLMGVCGWCVVTVGRNNYRSMGQGSYRGSLLLPAYTSALWLILSYQVCSGDPILQNYVYQLLAIICTLLAFYFMASFSFEKGKPLLTVWSCLAAVYFSAVTLLDSRNWLTVAFHGFAILYFVTHSAVLLHNLTAEREESTDE